MSKIKIFVATPTIGSIVDSQVYALRNIEKIYKDSVELVYPELCIRRVLHDFARNQMVEEFLKTDCDILWFLDSDVTPPEQVLDLVTKDLDKWEVAGTPYPLFMPPAGQMLSEVLMAVYDESPTGGFLPARVPMTGAGYVDAIGTGCMFIKRPIVEALKKPYFSFEFKEDSREIALGEDLGFCKKINELGKKFYIRYDYVCRHTKLMDLLDVNNYAIMYANRQVEAYDRMIKQQVLAATKAAYDKGFLAALERVRTEAEKEEEAKSKKLWTPTLITKI